MRHSENVTGDIIGRSFVEASYGTALAELVLAAIARISGLTRSRSGRATRIER